MKALVALLIGPLAVAVLVTGLVAQEKGKEVTLKGTILCAHCSLKEGTECKTAIQVKEGVKTVTYYLDDKGAGETYHEPVCGGGTKEGTVVGLVRDQGGKKHIKPSKVEYVKK